MTCNLEKNKGVSVKSLPLGGEGASLQFCAPQVIEYW